MIGDAFYERISQISFSIRTPCASPHHQTDQIQDQSDKRDYLDQTKTIDKSGQRFDDKQTLSRPKSCYLEASDTLPDASEFCPWSSSSKLP